VDLADYTSMFVVLDLADYTSPVIICLCWRTTFEYRQIPDNSLSYLQCISQLQRQHMGL